MFLFIFAYGFHSDAVSSSYYMMWNNKVHTE
jgi:hypothetical protein